jgi:hypothetical protein
MPENLPLFYDDIWAALRGLVSYCGGSKVVGPSIWPAKKEKAAAWLDDCLNPDRAAKLDPQEFIALLTLARERNFHGVMQYIGDETGYEVSPKCPKDELQAALESFDRKADDLMRTISAIQRARLKAVG